MALRLRRGTDAERLLVTPLEGELVYTTDTKKIFVGDGTTIGGTLVAGLNSVLADTTPQLGGNLDLNSKNITGIGNITIDGTVTAPQFEGNILADDSTLVFNSATQALKIVNLDISGDVDLTEATNKLDVFSNHSSTSSNIVLNRSKGTKASPTALVDNDNIFGIKFVGHDGTSYTGGASIISDIDGTVSTGNVPGDLSFKVTNSSGTELTPLKINSSGIIETNTQVNNFNSTFFYSVGSGSNARSIERYRSRGSVASPLVVNANDLIYQDKYYGYDGTTHKMVVRTQGMVGSSSISSGVMSGRFRIRATDSAGTEKTFFDVRGHDNKIQVRSDLEIPQFALEVGGVRVFQNRIFGVDSNADLEMEASGTGDVVISGGLRADGIKLEGNTLKTVDSNAPLEISASGTGIVSATNLHALNYMQLPVYANNTARDSAISSPNAGMLVFNTTGTKFQGYTGAAWVDLN
tara:strand:+ start:9222 stop:10616 length:1395 start_codon:yes stop_codon:yes gene_type:complete